MFKTLHRSLGRPPRDIGDYDWSFQPLKVDGMWARGDTFIPIHGNGWTIFPNNDWFAWNAAANDIHAIFRRNCAMMMDDSGNSYMLSSGDGFFVPGSVLVPEVTGGHWSWPQGGVPHGDSCVIFSLDVQSGVPYEIVGNSVMRIDSVSSATPTNTAPVLTGITGWNTVFWGGAPFRSGGHVYIAGYRGSDFTHKMCRHTFSSTPSDYSTGWEYWTGSAWSATFASMGSMTVPNTPLSPLYVMPYAGGFLASCKKLNSAPELIDPGTGLPYPDSDGRILAWFSANPQGPWVEVGPAHDDVRTTNWYSYAGFYTVLRGVSGLVAQWSLNGGPGPRSYEIYGPHWGDCKYPRIPKQRRRLGLFN